MIDWIKKLLTKKKHKLPSGGGVMLILSVECGFGYCDYCRKPECPCACHSALKPGWTGAV